MANHSNKCDSMTQKQLLNCKIALKGMYSIEYKNYIIIQRASSKSSYYPESL